MPDPANQTDSDHGPGAVPHLQGLLQPEGIGGQAGAAHRLLQGADLARADQ